MAKQVATGDDLFLTAEKLRMKLRDVVDPATWAPVSEREYLYLRGLLVTSPLAEPHLPDWLRDGCTLSTLRLLVRQAAGGRERGNFVRRRRAAIEAGFSPLLAALKPTATTDEDSDLSTASRQVHARVEHFFGAPLTVEQRAVQALALIPRSSSSPLHSFWRNILLLYPALAAILEHQLTSAGVNYADVVGSLLGSDVGPPPSDVSDTALWNVLGRSFGNYTSRHNRGFTRLKPFADEIRKAGNLLAVDILTAQLTPPLRSAYDVPPLASVLRLHRGSRPYATPELFAITRSLIAGLRQSFGELRALDQSCGEQQFAIISEGRAVRLVPFGTWSYCSRPSSATETGLYRGNVVQPATRFSSASLTALEDLINSNAPERSFQTFFEQNTEYLEALGPYTHAHPQLVLTEDSGSRLIPDFFLEDFRSGFCDICDLKRPTELLYKISGGRLQFRDRVMAGVRQLSEYRDYFEDRQNRRLFEQLYPHLKVFRPRVILIIGRRDSFYDEMERIRLESELKDFVSLRTYDDIAASARYWRDRIQESRC